MLDRRVKPVRDVTRGIRDLEKKCDAMIGGAAQLTLDMIAAAEACKLSTSESQGAFASVAAIFVKGIEVRSLSADAHTILAVTGVETEAPVAWGDDCPPPPPNPPIEQEDKRQPLKLVAA